MSKEKIYSYENYHDHTHFNIELILTKAEFIKDFNLSDEIYPYCKVYLGNSNNYKINYEYKYGHS